MQDSNLRDARAPTTVFETVAFPDSANPPDAATVVLRRARGSNARRVMMPGPRISNPVPSHSASPPVQRAARRGFEPRSPESESGVHAESGPTGTGPDAPGPRCWSLSRESNPVPPDYETGARPDELDRRVAVRLRGVEPRSPWPSTRCLYQLGYNRDERTAGVEPASCAWHTQVLPLNDARR